jgi:methionyl-tRNA synthetase
METNDPAPAGIPVPQPVPVVESRVSIDEFKKFKLVVGQIKEVTVHPNADKLFVVKVDIGTEVRQLVAGIRRSYTPEQLVGRRVVVITNLQPAVIRGVESQGMILAASDEQGVSVLQPDRDVVLGSGVK